MTVATKAVGKPSWHLIFAAVMLAGLLGRLIFLGDKALWLDEAYSVWFSNRSWQYLWQEVPQFETHPPMYYSILKLWRNLGSDEFTLRLLSALVSLATIPLIALTGYIAAPAQHKRSLAMTAGFLFAASSMQLEAAQQARPYAVLVFGMSLALACATWIIVHADRSGRSVFRAEDRAAAAAYLGLSIGMAILLWMHNLGAIYVFVIGGVLAAWWVRQGSRRPALFLNLAAAALLALALYAVNIPTLLLQTRVVSENFWLEAPSFPALLHILLQLYGQWLISLGTTPTQYAVQFVIVIPLAVGAAIAFWRFHAATPQRQWGTILLFTAAFGPFVMMLLLSYTVQPVLLTRTALPSQAAWSVIFAAAPLAVPPRWAAATWRVLIGIGCICILSFIASQASEEQRDRQRPWRAFAERIAQSDAPTAPVILIPNSLGSLLDYYDSRLDLGLSSYPLPDRYPVRGAHYDYPSGAHGEPAINEVALRRLENVSKDAETVWLITRVEDLYDPQHLVRSALSRHFACSRNFGGGILRLTRFDRPDAETGRCS